MQPQLVGKLSPEEKNLLIKQSNSMIKFYRYGFIICCCLFFLIVPLIIAPAFYIVLRKETRKRDKILQDDLLVFKVSGVVSDEGVHGGQGAYRVGDFLLPELVGGFGRKYSGLGNYLGQTVTAEYIPAIAKDRNFYDADGNGYSFITKNAIGNASLRN